MNERNAADEAEDTDVLDLLDGGEDEGTNAEPATGDAPKTKSRSEKRFESLSAENKRLRESNDRLERKVETELSYIKGRLDSKLAVEEKEPEDMDEHELRLYRLEKRLKAQDEVLARTEARAEQERASRSVETRVSVAMKGLKWTDADLAREAVESFVQSRPKASPEDVQTFARRLNKIQGPSKEKAWADGKRDIAAQTDRPTAVAGAPSKGSEGDKRPLKEKMKEREAAAVKKLQEVWQQR
jgi:hypothetical protein